MAMKRALLLGAWRAIDGGAKAEALLLKRNVPRRAMEENFMMSLVLGECSLYKK